MKTIKLKIFNTESKKELLAAIAASGYPTWCEDIKEKVDSKHDWLINKTYVYIDVPDDAIV